MVHGGCGAVGGLCGCPLRAAHPPRDPFIAWYRWHDLYAPCTRTVSIGVRGSSTCAFACAAACCLCCNDLVTVRIYAYLGLWKRPLDPFHPNNILYAHATQAGCAGRGPGEGEGRSEGPCVDRDVHRGQLPGRPTRG